MKSAASFSDIVRPHLGPPVNIEAIVRALGVKLNKKAQLDPQIAGQLKRLSDGSFEISANKDEHYYRQRFTIAHELGHYMLHSHLIGRGVADTVAYRSAADGNFYNPNILPQHETEANRFASTILMPGARVKEFAKPGVSIVDLGKKFQVSPQAMKIRLDTLSISNDGTFVSSEMQSSDL